MGVVIRAIPFSRAPYGARGLKSACLISYDKEVYGRAPYGARGLKFKIAKQKEGRLGSRAPYGARGLKYCPDPIDGDVWVVAPRMGRVD